MTRRAGNSAISSSISAGGYSRPQTANPNWRIEPSAVKPAVAPELCVSEVEGQFVAIRHLLDATGFPFPYGETA